MTPDQFDTARAKTKVQPRAANAARAVLVGGLSKSEAARQAKPPLTPEAVRMAVARIEREHRGVIGCPPDWECVTVCVPYFGESSDKIKEIERGEWRKAGLLQD